MLTLLLLASSPFLQAAPQAEPSFVEQPGVLEFTGQMLLHPKVRGDEEAAARLAPWLIRHLPETDLYVVRVPEGMTENSIAAAWMATGDYEYVHPDWMCYPIGDPNDPQYGSQWHHVNMESSSAWDLITGEANQIISWLDTGVDHAHPDLAAGLIPGYNAVDQQEEINGGDTSDVHGHGTHVAGCLGAIGNNGVGVAGMAWPLQLMPVRVSNSSSGGAYMSDLTGGATWAVDNGALTISASYSGVEQSAVDTVGTYVKNAGGLLFWAAGNSATNNNWFDWLDVIIVGATDINDNKTSWSSYGTAMDLVAPGDGILSTVVGGGYQAWSGTSMAAPLANGAAALIWAANPYLTPQQVEDRLMAGCDDLGSPGKDPTYGWGRVNLRNSVEGGLQGDMVLSVTPLTAGQAVTFSVSGASASLNVYFGYSLTGWAVVNIPGLGAAAGLAGATQIGIQRADASGNASLNKTVPVGAGGLSVWLQAVSLGDSSNLVATSVQ